MANGKTGGSSRAARSNPAKRRRRPSSARFARSWRPISRLVPCSTPLSGTTRTSTSPCAATSAPSSATTSTSWSTNPPAGSPPPSLTPSNGSLQTRASFPSSSDFSLRHPRTCSGDLILPVDKTLKSFPPPSCSPQKECLS